MIASVKAQGEPIALVCSCQWQCAWAGPEPRPRVVRRAIPALDDTALPPAGENRWVGRPPVSWPSLWYLKAMGRSLSALDSLMSLNVVWAHCYLPNLLKGSVAKDKDRSRATAA